MVKHVIILDIIAGHFLPSIFGWTFFAFVLTTESLLLSKYLSKTWLNKKVSSSALISNLVTTVIGYLMLDEENIGGHLLNWLPVYEYQGEIRTDRTLSLFIATFIGSVVIETLLNLMILKTYFSFTKISVGTFLVNVFTYIFGGIIIYLYAVYCI